MTAFFHHLWHRHGATPAWVALLALAGLSVAMADHAHHGGTRLWMAIAVAALAWAKGWLLVRHYLHAQHAGPIFQRIVALFSALAPLALVVSALREALLR